MLKDPIVQEVRKAGEVLAKQANYDLRDLFKTLRNSEKRSGAKVVLCLKGKKLKRAI